MDATLVVLLCLLGLSAPGLGLPPTLEITRLEPAESKCRADLLTLREGLDTGQRWAQTIWDSGVKSPVGLLSNTGVQFGDFDECLAVSSTSPRTPVTPQFCLVNVSPDRENTSLWSPFKWGMCVPASCSAQELQYSLKKYMDSSGEPVLVDVVPEACTTAETVSTNMTVADILYCAVVVSMVVIVCMATFYDMRRCPDYDGVSPPRYISQCLSARHGFYSLVKIDTPISGVNLGALYGLHSCAFFFVIMGHRFGAYFFFNTLTNFRSVEHMFVGSWFSIWAGHMDLFVDIFFFMSAFLLSFLYYAELHKRFVNPLFVYLYRLCRIVPAYALVVFFYATLLRQLGDGPLWNMFMDMEQGKCKTYWWANLLFINTYVEAGNMCLLQSWYISCDFQLFVVGAFLVFLLHQSPKSGLIVIVFVFVLSTVTPFLGTFLYDRPAVLLFYNDFWGDPRHHDMFTSVYSLAHYRGTSYLPGLLAGCYVYKHRKEPLTNGQTYALQTVGMATTFLVYWSGALFYDRTDPPSTLVASLYAAFFHTAFGLGMALVITSYTLGQKTWLTRLFSWRGFVPLSKLSFCVYLIHNIPQFVWVASSRAPVTLSPRELVSWTIADLVISLVASLVLCLTVETPIRYLIKFLVSGPPPSTTLPKTVEPQERYVIQEPFGYPKK